MSPVISVKSMKLSYSLEMGLDLVVRTSQEKLTDLGSQASLPWGTYVS